MLGLAAVLVLGACTTAGPPAPTGSYQEYPYQGSGEPTTAYSNGDGVVESIESGSQAYQGVGGTGYGLGTLAGAVIGGVAGSQVGSGRGSTAAAIAGTAGGAYIGHQLEKRNQQAADSYLVTIRMRNGAYQQLRLTSTGDLRVGDRVRVENGVIQRY